MRCELFEYEDEIIDTGIDDVDENVKDFGYIATIQMVGAAASTAVTRTVLASSLAQGVPSNSVTSIDIINGGSNYKSAPIIDIENPVGGGVTATAIAILDRGSISKILVTNPGIGYSIPPAVTIRSNSNSGSDGIATAIINSGSLGPIEIISGGVGYSTAPIITISPPDTFGYSQSDIATAEAIVNSSGSISSIRFTNSGVGYGTTPLIQISSPIGISTGDYEFNEVIRGVSTGTSAYVKDWNYDTRTLKVSIINGNFALGESIAGGTATYKVLSINTDNLYDNFAENIDIQEEADNILDFSEKNPFGSF